MYLFFIIYFHNSALMPCNCFHSQTLSSVFWNGVCHCGASHGLCIVNTSTWLVASVSQASKKTHYLRNHQGSASSAVGSQKGRTQPDNLSCVTASHSPLRMMRAVQHPSGLVNHYLMRVCTDYHPFSGVGHVQFFCTLLIISQCENDNIIKDTKEGDKLGFKTRMLHFPQFSSAHTECVGALW